MRIPALLTLIGRLPLCLLALCAATAAAQTATVPTLSVDPTLSRQPISPQIYGIANYGLDSGFAQEIQVPNIRWGGDGTTRYNWMVDSSNSGFDWYFIGGNGQATPVPGASADLMVKTYSTRECPHHDPDHPLGQQVRGMELQLPRLGLRCAAVHRPVR